MTNTALRDRPFQVFVSHAHADKAVVDQLHRWLSETAGVSTWYDATHLPPGALIASELGDALARCKAAIIILSKAAVASTWVKIEWNKAVKEVAQSGGEYRVIPILIEQCEIPDFLDAMKYVDFAPGRDSLGAYADLLGSLYAGAEKSDATPVDVYVSRTWRTGREGPLADQVCERLAAARIRLIGDSPDWPDFDNKRIRLIMRSCCGVVSIVPDRPRDKLKYFIEEIGTARALGLPLMIVAERAADLPDDIARVSLRAPAEGVAADPLAQQALEEAIQELREECGARPRAQHIFFATTLEDDARNQIVQRLLSQVTGLACFVGEKMTTDALQKALVQRIQDAVAVIADISDDNLNICIEAGIARGAGVPLHLVARGPRRSPPFMLRDMEPAFYENDAELLGVLHRIAQLYRRKVLAFGPHA